MLARLGWLLFWLAMGAAGVGALVMEWRHPPSLQTPIAVDTPPAVTVPPPQPFEPLSLTHYAGIVERPVFIDDRRPEEDELAVPPAPPPEPDQPLDLIGVLLVPGSAAALLRPTEPNAKILRAAQGEMVEGWRLQSVSADRVVLRKNGEIRELVLIRPLTPPRTNAPGRVVSPSGQSPILTPRPSPRPAPGS
jgi:hypothetical protein